MMRTWWIIWIATLMMLGGVTGAQEGQFVMPDESGRAFALSSDGNTIQLGEMAQRFGGTIAIDYHPADSRRWARVDNFGILRFVDPSNADLVEGVYTFAPFFPGFEASSASENKYFVREVHWSPDGRMLAFYIENESQPDLAQGLWFWQPLRESASDPAYQLMRPCPGFCSAAGVAEDYPGWDVLGFEWSSDNSAILVSTRALAHGGRRALTVRFAQRVDPPPATVTPTFLLYDYGHWGTDGQRIVVSGRAPNNEVVFGTIERNGSNAVLQSAGEIGMAWVQDAVQRADGSLLMLGSVEGGRAPLALIDANGNGLTPPIGDRVPDDVRWSPDYSAVMLTIGERVYVATISGLVYDISAQLGGSPNVSWVNGALPATTTPVNLPAPLASTDLRPETTTTSDDAPVTAFNVGDLLRVNEGPVNVYVEPLTSAIVVGVLGTGDELIITDAPLQTDDQVWYRVQTLDFTGWVLDAQRLTTVEE
ncbi:MAG: SH3 domain-containing protein [Anaerolineae bacterium]